MKKEKGKKINQFSLKDFYNKQKEKIEEKNIYISYNNRLIIYTVLFFVFLFSGVLLIYKSIGVDEAKIVDYQENGNIDYKVYLKPNEFYDVEYLTGGNTVIAKLIDRIEMTANYSFVLNESNINIDYNYEIIGKLTINSSDKKKLFEKDYTLVNKKFNTLKNKNNFSISEKLDIDYDYYNQLANDFRAAFGVETVSTLHIYLKVGKDVKNTDSSISLVNNKELSLNIPLTERTIDISISDTGLDNNSIILEQRNVKLRNITFVVLSAILFILSIVAMLKLVKLAMILFNNDSKYDKFISKVLKEYDRLIVETDTPPDLTNNDVIRIKKFNELLDVRDNLKRPIMHYVVNKHQKSYFFVLNEKTLYLLIIKAIDLENEKTKK